MVGVGWTRGCYRRSNVLFAFQFSYDISHKYPVEGNYTITVNVSNDLSFATMSRLITIENPIRGKILGYLTIFL